MSKVSGVQGSRVTYIMLGFLRSKDNRPYIQATQFLAA